LEKSQNFKGQQEIELAVDKIGYGIIPDIQGWHPVDYLLPVRKDDAYLNRVGDAWIIVEENHHLVREFEDSSALGVGFFLVCQPDVVPVLEHPDTHLPVIHHLDFDVKEIPLCLFLGRKKYDVRTGRVKVPEIFGCRRSKADGCRIIVHAEPGIDKRDGQLLLPGDEELGDLVQVKSFVLRREFCLSGQWEQAPLNAKE